MSVVLGGTVACAGRPSEPAKSVAPSPLSVAVPPPGAAEAPRPDEVLAAKDLARQFEQRLQARFPDLSGKFVSIEMGMHLTDVMDADVDAAETFAVTASTDRTARVWSLRDGKQLAVLRVPQLGIAAELNTVAVAPAGDRVALAGYDGGVYVFDTSNWHLSAQIPLLRKTVHTLRYSRDGKRLALGGHGRGGLKIYETSHYQLIFEDGDFDADIYGLAFDAAGVLAVTSWDHSVRLYSPQHRLLAKKVFPNRPYRVAFDPARKRLLVGFSDGAIARVLKVPSLDTERELEPPAGSSSSLGAVAFATDGSEIFASGRYNQADGRKPILRWKADFTPLEPWFLPQNTPECLRGISGGKLLLTAQDPLVALFEPSGSLVWSALNRVPAFGKQPAAHFHASRDASLVEFDWGRGSERAAFDIRHPALLEADPRRGLTPATTQSSRIDVQRWENQLDPTLAGQRLDVQRFEVCRSLAISGQSFLLGCEWDAYAFDESGQRLWKRGTDGSARGAFLSENGQLGVLALDDGSLRWLNAATGDELVNVAFVGSERDWVAWTPEGFYVGTPRGEHAVGLSVLRSAGSVEFVPLE
ncbi:MAG TPA: hypothetical protein VFK05_15305, partial [Polyangiaceae bacterium]|nr:hypothetical protein [Polyangiaceae bacterium]